MDHVRVAVDCGGTSSRALLLVDGDNGCPRTRFDGAASLSGYLEPSRISSALRALMGPIDERYRADGLVGVPVVVAICAAGFDDSLRAEYRRAVREVFADAFGGLTKTVIVANDAVGLLLGHRADGALIAGTGSNVLMRAADGGVVQYGGRDWAAADEGSAFWIGLDGIRAVARDTDDGTKSTLYQRFRQVYATEEVGGRLRSLAVAGPQMKAEIARFAVGVCDAAAAGDVAAGAIVDRQAEALADTFARAMGRAELSGRRGIRVVECGGLMGDRLFREALHGHVRERVGGGVEWRRVVDGLDAAAALADETMSVADGLAGHAPLVVRFG